MAITTLGIDPGQNGAAALLIDGRFESVVDYSDGPSVIAALDEWLLFHTVDLVVLELVGAMPKQGVSSTFKFGANYGWWKGVLDANKLPWREVRPQAWQAGMVPRKTTPTDKPSLPVARRLFPSAPLTLKKHDGRSDAILMAYWAFLQLNQTGGKS